MSCDIAKMCAARTVGIRMSPGDVLSIIGLAIAIWQLWRMGKITAATKKAIDDATKRIGVYNLLLIVPKLSRLEHEIENAAIKKSSEELRRLLVDWRESASELRGVLASDGDGSSHLDALAKESINLAALAKHNLIGKESPDLLNATKRVRNSIEQVCRETTMLAAQITSTANPLGVRRIDLTADGAKPANTNSNP